MRLSQSRKAPYLKAPRFLLDQDRDEPLHFEVAHAAWHLPVPGAVAQAFAVFHTMSSRKTLSQPLQVLYGKGGLAVSA